MTDKKLTVLYGSQSGTAQEVAEKIWRESKHFGFVGPVLSMNDYEMDKLINESVIVFVCSTTGQGNEPDNMKKFWKHLLRKSLPIDLLQNVRVAVLGLGDSSYAKYNFAGKKLFRRLQNLGALKLCELGLADDQHELGIDAVVYRWIKDLWNALFRYYRIENVDVEAGINCLLPPRWKVDVEKQAVSGEIVNETLPRNNSYVTTCLENRRVTPTDHFQDVRLMKFSLTENLYYVPGDVLSVMPVNSEEAVREFFKLFSDRQNDINENTIIRVNERYADMPVPDCLQDGYLHLKTLVKEYWNLNVVPSRYTFELLSYFTDDDLEREKLQEFICSEGQQELYNYCNRQHRTILEVLSDFPHATANIPIEYFCEVFQPIRPRSFSIASSPKAHVGEIHILVAVVKYKTKLKKMRIGLGSSWLSRLKERSVIPVNIKKGSLSFPMQKCVPVLMVGPGTGIAPFRSYSHEDIADEESKNDLHVYFGCRNRTADFYFEDEWLQLKSSGRLSLYTAFSRDQSDKIYVQDVIRENTELVKRVLSNPQCRIFIAGNAKNMPDSVRNTFKSILAQVTNSEQNAEKYIEKMELTGRYQTETWS